jgi:hypothetical protein
MNHFVYAMHYCTSSPHSTFGFHSLSMHFALDANSSRIVIFYTLTTKLGPLEKVDISKFLHFLNV